MSDVFISYSRADATFANGLADELRKKGVDVFIDKARLEAGSDWRKELSDAISKSIITAVLWSPRSVESAMVQWEADQAVVRDKYVPFTIAACTLPNSFLGLHSVDVTAGSSHQQIKAIVSTTIRMLINKKVAACRMRGIQGLANKSLWSSVGYLRWRDDASSVSRITEIKVDVPNLLAEVVVHFLVYKKIMGFQIGIDDKVSKVWSGRVETFYSAILCFARASGRTATTTLMIEELEGGLFASLDSEGDHLIWRKRVA